MISSKQRHALRLLVLLVVLSGCGSYGKIEVLAYEQVKSLYTVCNQKNTEQLEKVAERITKEYEAGELSSHEIEWLEAIINEARSGEWKAAAAKCRGLMEAQVER